MTTLRFVQCNTQMNNAREKIKNVLLRTCYYSILNRDYKKNLIGSHQTNRIALTTSKDVARPCGEMTCGRPASYASSV